MKIILLAAPVTTGKTVKKVLKETAKTTTFAVQGTKVGTRSYKAFLSYQKGGVKSPALYLNAGSALLSLGSAITNLPGINFPRISGSLFAASTMLASAADKMDLDSTAKGTIFF
jgi:hypothetical protein